MVITDNHLPSKGVTAAEVMARSRPRPFLYNPHRMQLRTVAATFCTLAFFLVSNPLGQQPTNQTPLVPSPAQVRERWDKEFKSGAPDLRNQAGSELLMTVVKDRTPGTALDLGVGQGRNALFLAERGWKVTGVDISEAAVAQARANADKRKLAVTAVVADLDAFDFGNEQWDLITSFYMHSWHKNSKTDVPARIYRSLRPGGVLVVEAFRRPPNPNGLVTSELATLFKTFRILRNDEVVAQPDWGPPTPTNLVRFVAEKPRA